MNPTPEEISRARRIFDSAMKSGPNQDVVGMLTAACSEVAGNDHEKFTALVATFVEAEKAKQDVPLTRQSLAAGMRERQIAAGHPRKLIRRLTDSQIIDAYCRCSRCRRTIAGVGELLEKPTVHAAILEIEARLRSHAMTCRPMRLN